jgi:DNA-binding CsgD family transcriptional regulator
MANALGIAAYSGEQLWGLTERLRLQVFRATLVLAALIVLPAAVMIVLVDKDVGLRLTVLMAVGVLCVLAASRAGWCADRLRARGELAFLPALLGAAILVGGGARQNATFLVIAVVLVGIPAVVEITNALAAGGIVVVGYVFSILARGESFLFDGSAGDLAALLSLLVAIYAANRVVELAAATVTDSNRDAKAASIELGEAMPMSKGAHFVGARNPMNLASVRVTTEEATDQARGEALKRLSEYELSPALREVALHAGDGLPPKEIAKILGKSEKTVENQLALVKTKLGAENRAGLAAKVVEILSSPLGRATDEELSPPNIGPNPDSDR